MLVLLTMQSHLDFLNKHSDAIQAAGPLFNAIEKVNAGGLWIVKTDSVNKVENYIKSDPFWPTGLRKSYQILEWRQVFNSSK